MSDIIKDAFDNIDPESEIRLDEKIKKGEFFFGFYDIRENKHKDRIKSNKKKNGNNKTNNIG